LDRERMSCELGGGRAGPQDEKRRAIITRRMDFQGESNLADRHILSKNWARNRCNNHPVGEKPGEDTFTFKGGGRLHKKR